MNGLTRVLLVLVLLGVRSALALDPARHITELVHRVWDSKSGVPPEIRALAQTTDGYLWVGSLRGLYRFDGMQFHKFEPESGARLPSHEIRSLFAAPDGTLWIGYLSGGVSVLAAGRLINYNSGNGFPEGKVIGFARERNGRVWVASSGGLAYLEGDRWHTVGNDSNFPGSGAQAVLVDRLGALWVAGQHRIAVLNPGSSKFELTDEAYNGQVLQLAESRDGTVWMAETSRAVRPLKRPGETVPSRGMSRLDCQNRFPDTWQTEPRCRRPDDLEVRVGSAAILFDQNDGFWITTIGDGLRRAPYPSQLPKEPIGEFSNALEQFTSKDGLSSDYVTAISEDREDNIWVGTRDGIDQFRNSVLAPVTLGPAAAQLSIVPDKDGYVVALDSGGNMFRFHDAHRVDKLRPLTFTHLLYRDLFGSIWGSGTVGCRLVGSECVTRLEVPGGSLGDQEVRLAVDGNHRLWAYNAEEGLFAFENGRWSRFRAFPPALMGAVAGTQYSDAAGRIWFGFRDGRLLTLTDGVAHLHSPKDGLNLGEIKAIASVGTHVWIGGEHGLVLLRGQRFTPVVAYDALAFGSVSGIVAADDGSLWLNEDRGIIRVSAPEVSAILRDRSHPTQYDLFDTFDGLPGATEAVKCPTAIRGTDGRLWFTTINGAAWVDPGHLYRNKLPPPVVIKSIVADGRTLSSSSKLELPARTKDLQIAYAGLSLSVPERVQFRYRLKGLDDTWQNAGTRRTAYYTKLPPGSYDFQVIASNDAGVWNKIGAQLPIRIIPAWYQTWWFYSLCAFLVAAALAALYRLRIAQVRAQAGRLLVARLSERERIARDLHDTLLQGFQGLLLRFHAVLKQLRNPDTARPMLEAALDRAEEVLRESRSRLAEMQPENDHAEELSKILGDFGNAFADRAGPTFRSTPEGDPRTVKPAAKLAVVRIGRECIANAFLHAEATRIEARVIYGWSTLQLRVSDDGKGIPAEIITAGVPGHWGLANIREEARKLGSTIVIESNVGAGTTVRLSVAARHVYADSRAGSLWDRLLNRGTTGKAKGQAEQ